MFLERTRYYVDQSLMKIVEFGKTSNFSKSVLVLTWKMDSYDKSACVLLVTDRKNMILC